MSKIRVAINGFGRIGRLTARELFKQKDVELVAINDLSDVQTLIHLLKYDSLHGKFSAEIKCLDKSVEINDQVVYFYNTKEPENLPWKALGVDVVLECTGVFRKPEEAKKHIKAGAKRVILSAPPKGEGIKQIVLGVNDQLIEKNDLVISNASCTTNCAAPIIKILDQAYKIKKGILTTIHAYTSDQRIHDAPHRDLRRARAAAYNIIPTTTGASQALESIFPRLKGKLSGSAIRVPVATGSITELTLEVETETSVKAINSLVQQAAAERFKNILHFTEDQIVSSDIVSNTYSSIFDAGLTLSMGNLIKVSSWYDNEMGYSNRMAELAILFGGM